MKNILTATAMFLSTTVFASAMDFGSPSLIEMQGLEQTVRQIKERVTSYRYAPEAYAQQYGGSQEQLVQEIQRLIIPESVKASYSVHAKNSTIFERIIHGVVPVLSANRRVSHQETLHTFQQNAQNLKATADDFLHHYNTLVADINELKRVFPNTGESISVDDLTSAFGSLSVTTPLAKGEKNTEDEPKVIVSVHSNSHTSTIRVEGGGASIHLVHQHSHSS